MCHDLNTVWLAAAKLSDMYASGPQLLTPDVNCKFTTDNC